MDQPEVLFEFRNSIALITLNRPACLNTLTGTLARELLDLLMKLQGFTLLAMKPISERPEPV
jgi:enoyl-CoA hydratase/carnithine racemase